MQTPSNHLSNCHPDHINDRHPGPRAQDLCNSSTRTKFSSIKATLFLLYAILREIFDERAYDRYLARTHAARGRESYRAFTTERIAMTARKPRCC